MRKILLLFLLLNLTINAYTQQPTKKAIIVLTYDDALQSQLKVALPQLESAHLNGTFFLAGYNVTPASIPAWREVAKKGNELANHTLYHPCIITTGKGNPANNSANYTVYTILREISETNNLLYAVDGKTSRTFAYPCTELAVGGVNYVDSLRTSGLIKYARIGGNADAVITDFKTLDPLLVPSWAAVGVTTGDELIAFVKKVQQRGGMGVFMFHGVGGDYLTTPALAHKQLLTYLRQHANEIEVLTFQQAMDKVSQAKHH
ncbi:polysaccharide deacetylase family protein [Mucilaginibacter sp. SP1R1]|uniref:polysaccharide deacetylase family protein n=1 Tax=Mucilaginibacter sp. SP1R1 TaxID=2723091 RepID=UPI001612445C|nr:polysaccharide deacetylase family protein [Mucilaginibacter sp. SP1R1]MBB6147948.1 sialate O-acetylesterase [Mucilaginibacter sp. SP1R1]